MTLRAALALAAKGLHVIPTMGKRPVVGRGVYDASTDPERIRSWSWTARNIAVATGASGVAVIDIDRKHGIDGGASLAVVERVLGPLPATLTSATPSGGEHRWFRAPAGIELRPVQGKIGEHDAPGVDLRCGSALCTIPPSKGYAWISLVPMAPLPEAWTAAITPKPRPVYTEPAWTPSTDADHERMRAYSLAALQAEARELASMAPGLRNAELWRAAAALGGLIQPGALYASEVERALEWACDQWGRERNRAKDRNTIRRGITFGIANPRRLDLGGSRAA